MAPRKPKPAEPVTAAGARRDLVIAAIAAAAASGEPANAAPPAAGQLAMPWGAPGAWRAA